MIVAGEWSLGMKPGTLCDSSWGVEPGNDTLLLETDWTNQSNRYVNVTQEVMLLSSGSDAALA